MWENIRTLVQDLEDLGLLLVITSTCDCQLQLHHYKTEVSKGIMKFYLHPPHLQISALEMNWKDSVCPMVLMYGQDIWTSRHLNALVLVRFRKYSLDWYIVCNLYLQSDRTSLTECRYNAFVFSSLFLAFNISVLNLDYWDYTLLWA